MIGCCLNTSNGWEYVTGLSGIITSSLSLGLGYYVFIHQKKKEKKELKLDWFKELILLPNLPKAFEYFEKVNISANNIKSDNVDDNLKMTLIDEIKNHQIVLRKELLDMIQHLDVDLYLELMKIVDGITDELTEKIFDDSFDVTNEVVFNKQFLRIITSGHQSFFSTLFSFTQK